MQFSSPRLAVVGAVVFLANAGLLVLQLVAGPLLSPFIGSSLETWTSIIASFLIGIAAGNFFGGRIADRSPTSSKLARFLFLGAVAALWTMLLPMILKGGLYQVLPLGLRIPVLALALCLPVAFVLSLLTPLAIRICVPDIASTGRIAGLIFALSTLGCLLGNYLTGFLLIPQLQINAIIGSVTALLLLAAVAVIALRSLVAAPNSGVVSNAHADELRRSSMMPIAIGFAIVFMCSFAGMTLELSASRLIARILGSSIYTWTGVIGVMLFGTASGNFFGGRLADRAGGKADSIASETALGWTLLSAGLFGVLVIVVFALISHANAFATFGLREQILAVSFALFFAPMFALGMVSPQVIRLCVKDVGSSGRVAGRIYAVSTLGAILGTFAAGYAIISTVGMFNAILIAGIIPALAMLLVANEREEELGSRRKPLISESGAMLYGISTVFGAAFGGFILSGQLNRIEEKDGSVTETVAQTNYYTILINTPGESVTVVPPTDVLGALVGGAGIDTKLQVIRSEKSSFRSLTLDHLRHSTVDLDDPKFFGYHHETIQAELLRLQTQEHPGELNVLVIGGGGYTFPRYVRTEIPQANVDVVEIDPGVTKVAYEYLGLKREWGVKSFHMDGRQFVSEQSAKGHYDLVTLDAVNDLSVPSHLLTKECNEAVKATLKPEGVYLVTVIDLPKQGLLWKAAFRTLQKSFAHVELLYPLSDARKAQETLHTEGQSEPTLDEAFAQMDRNVLVIYAADRPLDLPKLKMAVKRQTGIASDTYLLPPIAVEKLLNETLPMILTDQHAPTDDLMRQVFRKR